MALDTYSGLKDSISMWMARQDLDPQIPDFIKIAEAQLNNNGDLRIQEMICKVLTEITGRELGLPTDYLGMRLLRHRDGAGIKQSPASLLHSCDDTLMFSNLGKRLELNQEVDQLDVDLFYYQKIPALSDTNQTNWLLDLAPYVYLYGSLLAASAFLKDDPRLGVWAEQYQAGVQDMIDADGMDRWSGQLQVRIA